MRRKGYAANRGFSTMLPSEHILMDLSLISFNPNFTNRALEYTISILSLISNTTGLR